MIEKNETPRQRPAAAYSHKRIPFCTLTNTAKILSIILPRHDSPLKAKTILKQRLQTKTAQAFFLNKTRRKEVESPIFDCLDAFDSVGKHVTD